MQAVATGWRNSTRKLAQLPISVGADRLHAPRCAVSACLALLAVDAHNGGYLTSPATPPTAITLLDQQTRAECVSTTLWHVITPLYRQLTQAAGASSAEAVLASVSSPADLAAALTALFTAVHCFLAAHLHGLVEGSSLAHVLHSNWATLLETCCYIMDVAAYCLSPGSHSSQGEMYFVQHEAWRAALQQNRTSSAVARVIGLFCRFATPSISDATTSTVCCLVLQTCTPLRMLLLVTSLTHRLSAALHTDQHQQPAACMRGPLASMLRQQLGRAQQDAARDVGVIMDYVCFILSQPPTALLALQPQQALAVARAHDTVFFPAVAAPLRCVGSRMLPLLLDLHSRLDLTRTCLHSFDLSCSQAQSLRLLCDCYMAAQVLPVRLAQWLAAVKGVPVESFVAHVTPPSNLLPQGLAAASTLFGSTEPFHSKTAYKSVLAPQLRGTGSHKALGDGLTNDAFTALWDWSRGVRAGALVAELQHACRSSSSSDGSSGSSSSSGSGTTGSSSTDAHAGEPQAGLASQGQASPGQGQSIKGALQAIREAAGIAAVGEDRWSESEQQLKALGMSVLIGRQRERKDGTA